jgi:hypothetical protein
LTAIDRKAIEREKTEELALLLNNALAKFLAHPDALRRSARVKYIRLIAFNLTCQRGPDDRPSVLPYKGWPQAFYKRCPELDVSKQQPLDWKRFDIYDKAVRPPGLRVGLTANVRYLTARSRVVVPNQVRQRLQSLLAPLHIAPPTPKLWYRTKPLDLI